MQSLAVILLNMFQFDTPNDFQTYLTSELSKREEEIDSILYGWFRKSLKSEMFILTAQGFYTIDTKKAQDHFKLIHLYHLLLSNELTFKERKNPHDITLKSISPRVNAKRLRDFNEFNEKQEKNKRFINSTREHINNILEELKLKHTIDELKDDINGTRLIIKELIQNILPLYGIDLDTKVVNRIFGRKEFKKDKQKVDIISFFTNTTSFSGSLPRQFSITKGGQASGLFSAFFMRSAGLLESYGNERDFEQIMEVKSRLTHNPFFREKQVLRILAMIYVTCYSQKKYS